MAMVAGPPSGALQHGASPHAGPMQMYGGAPGQPVIFNIQGGSSSASSAVATTTTPQVVIVKTPFRHGIHLFMSCITAGLWIPIWVVAYLLHPK